MHSKTEGMSEINVQRGHTALLTTSREHEYDIVVHAWIDFTLCDVPAIDDAGNSNDQGHVQDQNLPGLAIFHP